MAQALRFVRRGVLVVGMAAFGAAVLASGWGRAEPPDAKAALLQLCDAACTELKADNRRVPFYQDSYAVRAMAVAYDLTAKPEYLAACKQWADRMVAFQAKMTPRGAYYMNYGRKPGEDKGEWYVADSASIALGVLATAVRCPEQADRQRYVDSAKAYADLVVEKYVGPKGGITDGLWSKFDGEWWCSSGIFASLAFLLYDQTGDARYEKAAWGAIDWLNELEVREAQHISFAEAAPTVIMYVYEAYSTALPRMKCGDRHQLALLQLKVALDWMAENQAGRGKATWKYTTQWGSKLGGLPFHMYVWDRQDIGVGGRDLAKAADQELAHITGLVFQSSPLKFDQLAIFSMMSYAEKVAPGALYRKAR